MNCAFQEWCLVTLRLHRSGFKTAEQDTKSTRPSIAGLPWVTLKPGYPHLCLKSCITPPSAVLTERAWWLFMATSTVSWCFCAGNGLQIHRQQSFSTNDLLLLLASLRSSLLRPDLAESPSPGHVAAPAPPQPLALQHDPSDPLLWPRTLTLDPLTTDACRRDAEFTRESARREDHRRTERGDELKADVCHGGRGMFHLQLRLSKECEAGTRTS